MQTMASSRLTYVCPTESCRILGLQAPRNLGKQLFERSENLLSQFAYAPAVYFVDPGAEKEPMRVFCRFEQELPPLTQVLVAPKHVLFGAVVPQGFSSRSGPPRPHIAVFAVLASGAIHVEEVEGPMKLKAPPNQGGAADLAAAWPSIVADCARSLFEQRIDAMVARCKRGHPILAKPIPAAHRTGWLSAGKRSLVVAIEQARLRFEAAMTHAALREAHGVEVTSDPMLLAVSANRLAAADTPLVHLTTEARRQRRESLRLRRRDQNRACPAIAALFDLLASTSAAKGFRVAPPSLQKALCEIDAGRSPYAVIRDLTGLDKAKQKGLAVLGVDDLTRADGGFSGQGILAMERYVRTFMAMPQRRVPKTEVDHKALLSTIAALQELYDAETTLALVVADTADHARRAQELGARTALRDAVADLSVRLIAPLLRRRQQDLQVPADIPHDFSWTVALQALRPSGLKGLARFQEHWHRDLAKIEAADVRASRAARQVEWAPLLGDIDLSDGWRATELASKVALRAEGGELRHCVATYDAIVRSGRSVIFSLQNQDGDRATCEIANFATAPRVSQNLSRRNRRPSDAAIAAGERLARALAELEEETVKSYLNKLGVVGRRNVTQEAVLEDVFRAFRSTLESALGRLASKEADVTPDAFATHHLAPAVQRLVSRERLGSQC